MIHNETICMPSLMYLTSVASGVLLTYWKKTLRKHKVGGAAINQCQQARFLR